MGFFKNLSFAAVGFVALSGTFAAAQEVDTSDMNVSQISTHLGEMSMTFGTTEGEVNDTVRFEPFQGMFDLFFRNDVVYLMRHGPTDWSKRDIENVAPTDCANQRIMTSEGAQDMRNLGNLLAANRRLPAKIVVSEWCRNQQTLEHLLEGFSDIDADAAKAIPVETDASLNLLLSLQGAPSTKNLQDRISNWKGDPDRSGPLLIISHYTNIEELTDFRVYEGEILVVDPERNNRVLGYLRLASAGPDLGHFGDALASPLMEQDRAFSMIETYYSGLNDRDFETVDGLLSDDWYSNNYAPTEDKQNAQAFIDEVKSYTEGMPNALFQITSQYYADDVVTVIGTVRGTHTGTLFGKPATGRDVLFNTIGVHKIEDGKIAESWQMADRLSLIQQIE